MKKQQGFTLIELIIVIVILGILSAIALPKFVNLSGDARGSVVQGVAGSMAAANALVSARANILGTLGTTATPVNVNVGGATVSVANGFAATAAALALVMDLQPTTDFTTVGNTIQHARATTVGVTCHVAYTPATLAATVITPPTYVATITGC